LHPSEEPPMFDALKQRIADLRERTAVLGRYL
jgi:hypothetical protein